MRLTDKSWIDGYFDGYRSGQISLLDLIKQKAKEDKPYMNTQNEVLPWEIGETEGVNS